jgi:hypothetical protein
VTNNDRPTSATGRGSWFKSSYSNALGSCVEVNFGGAGILIRDSKDKRIDFPVISTGGEGWAAFLGVVATHPLAEPESGS